MQSARVLAAARAAAHAGEVAKGFQLFEQFRNDVARSREAATLFAELLARDPSYPDSLSIAEQITGGFATDPEVIILLSAALLRVAEQRPADEPPFEQGAAHLAAGACQRCFEALDPAARIDPDVGGYLQVNMADALRMMGPDHDRDALQAYQVALAIDDARGGWWFQLGLLHKWRGRFREGLEANLKARARLGATRPVLWNLAICATALGEGARALDAWELLGIRGSLAQSGMPFVPDMPPLQVRVATVGEETGQHDPLPARAVTFEVLWVQPLSPCHGVVQSPTARRASVDYGDVVLWDGAPVHMNRVRFARDPESDARAQREPETRDVPVFPLLWILRPGDERRLRFVGMEKERGLVDALGTALGEQATLVVFDRRSNVEARASARERNGAAADAHLFYGKLIVPGTVELNEVRRALEAALRARPGLTMAVPELYEQLGDTAAAGKAHQAWGGIERAAERQAILPTRAKR